MGFLKDIYTKQRFSPNVLSVVINPFYFTRKRLFKGVRGLAPTLSGRLLDFGCGSKPYKRLFVNATEYIGVDIENEGHDHRTEEVDVYYDGKVLPFEDGRFDSVLCSEVLEHVPDLEATLRELNRVLVKGGKVLITVPFVWPEHELPFDFRRFTANGLTEVFEKNGFEVRQMKKVGKFFEVVAQMWLMYLHNGLYTKRRYLNLLINAVFLFPFTLLGIVFSALLPNVQGLYFGLVMLAEKK